MPSLDPNSWTRRDWSNLDRHITGNWEGNYMYDPNDQDPPEDDDPTKVYIDHSDATDLCLREAYTGERLSDRPEIFGHNLIELANANGWEVVSGPLQYEADEDTIEEPSRSAYCASGQHNWVADPTKRQYTCADCGTERNI